ncbi:MAG: T9SS type A sorting domain-containing protein [Bacteroidota bacterium]
MKTTLFVSLFTFLQFLLVSQTGPAGIGTSANNVLWLKGDAGTSTTTNGASITSWNDQSGNAINVTQTVTTRQPTYLSNAINGMPAILFDAAVDNTNDKLYAPDNSKLDNTAGLSMFTVSGLNATIASPIGNNEARTIISKRNNVGVQESYMLFYYTSNKLFLDVEHSTDNRFSSIGSFAQNTNYIINFIYDGSLTAANRVKLYFGETLDRAANEGSAAILNNNSPLIIGSTHESDDRPFGGYIAEIITYTTTLNKASRIIVNNYLSAKYNIALSANDKYTGDNAGNGNYDRNVAGVGQDTIQPGTVIGSNLTFSASATLGMGISVSSGLGIGDYILAGHATTVNSVNISDVSGVSGVNPGRWQRVWYVDVTNAGAVIQADVEFDMVAGGMTSTTPVTAANYRLLRRSGTSGAWSEVATASSISGTRVIFNSYNFNNDVDDGYYTIGTTNYATSPLPIELLSFDAIMNDKKVDITWATATESNNDYYTIEKSKDGISFETVSIVDAAGNSLSTVHYSDVDYNPYEGIFYYRLKQTDLNGTFTYSKIVAVNYMISDDGFTMFPNPTDGNINLSLKGLQNQEVLVVVRDMTGKECFSKVILSQENNIVIAIDTEGTLAKGTYIVIASSNNKLYSQKILVK